MQTDQRHDEEAFLATVDTRLTIWRVAWNGFMGSYFLLGVTGVVCSTIAASKLFEDPARQWLSLVSAVCLAIIGFLRPEARYRNLVRAWRELKSAKDAYLFQSEDRSELLQVLRECEAIATEDDAQSVSPRKHVVTRSVIRTEPDGLQQTPKR
jgi:hypothetical protein